MPPRLEKSIFEQMQGIVGGTSVVDVCANAVDSVVGIHRGDVPVNLARLSRKLGIPVTQVETEEFEGLLLRSEDLEPSIHLSKGRNSDRTRFTWAHEIGHWIVQELLDTPKRSLFRGAALGPCHDEEEELADALAAELLMPASFVTAVIGQTQPCFDVLESLGQTMEVSWQAIMRRIADLAQQSVLYVEALPGVFNDHRSYAIIDDAWLARTSKRIACLRESVRFAHCIPFVDLPFEAEDGVELRINANEEYWKFETRVKCGSLPCVRMLGFSRN